MKDSNTLSKEIYSSIQYVFLHHLCQHKEPWTNKAHVRTEQKLHTFWGYSFLYSGQKPCPLFVSFGTRTRHKCPFHCVKRFTFFFFSKNVKVVLGHTAVASVWIICITFFLNVSSSILASIDSLQPLPLRLSPPKAWTEKRDMKGMFAL